MANHESNLQIACVRWFKFFQYKELAMLLFAIPNGGQRNRVTAAYLKKEGVTAGVHDLFLSVPRAEFHGLYIEMKFGNNKLTQKQIEFKKQVEAQGYKSIIIYEFDDFVEEVTNYLNL